MKNLHKKVSLLLVAFVALLISAMFATAEVGNTSGIDRGDSERYSLGTAPGAEQAEAGNVTGFSMNATSLTQRWQGFYGNITGDIVLGDGSNNLFYSWGNANPDGEIFAANHTGVNWNGLYCVNLSPEGAPDNERYNESNTNRFIGYLTDSERAKADSMNGTFNQSFTSSVTVGSTTFSSTSGCFQTTPYTSGAYQTSNFLELLLSDNESLVFMGILEQSLASFDGTLADFQMMVGVNGSTQGTTRDYYFFVELS